MVQRKFVLGRLCLQRRKGANLASERCCSLGSLPAAQNSESPGLARFLPGHRLLRIPSSGLRQEMMTPEAETDTASKVLAASASKVESQSEAEVQLAARAACQAQESNRQRQRQRQQHMPHELRTAPRRNPQHRSFLSRRVPAERGATGRC